MNNGIVASKLGSDWRWFAQTRSNQSAWAFDRLRLYTPNWYTKVAVFKNVNGTAGSTGRFVMDRELVEVQPFSTINDFEHDFTFDLSWNTNNDLLYIAITGVPIGAMFSQVYAYPTGYGGTRGKNAELEGWHLNMVNPEPGADDTANAYLRLENQNIRTVEYDSEKIIKANYIYLQNNGLWDDNDIDDIIIAADNNGLLNGVLDFSGNTGVPTSVSRAAYDSLVAKGWTITGTAPPTS